MPVTAIAVGAGLKAVQGGMAYARERKAARQLRELSKQPLPQYSATPQLQRYYQQALQESRTPEGFTPEQRAQFQGQMGSAINARMAAARGMSGGQLGRAVRGTSIADKLTALNQFAAQDAAIARQNRMAALGRLGGATSQMQSLANQNVGNLYQRRMMTEQALGRAQQQNRDIWQQAIGDTGSDLMSAGTSMYAYNKAYPTNPTGGTGVEKTTTLPDLNMSFAPPVDDGRQYEMPVEQPARAYNWSRPLRIGMYNK